jgi:F-type H+-transporting ATPase subunit gamma
LCGTYNERVLSLAQGFLREHPSAQVVAIGKKGNRAFGRRGIGRVKEILDWGGRYEPQRALELLAWIEGRYTKGEISSWWIATTRFISALNFKPVVERFLPILSPSPLEREGKGEGLPEKVIAEPDRASVTEDLLRRYLRAKFARILLEAFTSEHSARMLAMKNATDNAGEMVEHLTLIRNKVRQAAITKELIEVVSGAEALK